MSSSEFWRGRRVFLTGHTGFKGAWLAVWLHKMGAVVAGFALPPETAPNLHELTGGHRLLSSCSGDIRDAAALREALVQFQPEVVLHLAAQALVRRSYNDPVGTYATNVMGTVHLLEAVRACPSVTAVVVVSSDKCYENREWVWGYRENDPMGGHDPYSNSKGCTELVAGAYRSSFFGESMSGSPALATARAGNVIGGGDWALDRLVPDLLRAFEKGVAAEIRNPLAIRPWQHVLEPLGGYLLLAEKLATQGKGWAQGWNFGPAESDARPVAWIADRLVQAWGSDARWQTDDQVHPHEAHWLKLDCSKARQQLGWQPRWNLGQALERIVSWHQAYLARRDMLDVCLEQIDEYESALNDHGRLL
jgi:CDP-glucose 4,6-dehydratase